MASAKLILDKRFGSIPLTVTETGIDNNLYPLKIRIFHGRIFRDIPLGYKFKKAEWKEGENKVGKGYRNSERVNASIQRKFSIALDVLEEYRSQIERMEIGELRKLVEEEIEKQLFSDKNLPLIVEKAINRKTEEMIYLNEFGQKLIERKRKKGCHGTANWYQCGLTAILKYVGKDILITEINASFLENFEAHCIENGMAKNGVSSYLRATRTIVNFAVKELLNGKRFDGYPWGVSYVIPHEKTKKRAVPKDVFKAVRSHQYKEGCVLWHSKNYLLFMFNMRGMNFIDLAKLKVNNVTFGNRVEYIRSKTGKPYSIGLTAEAKEILKYYLKPGASQNDFIFPIGFEETEIGLKTYNQKRKRYNGYFKQVVKDATGQNINFTSYVIRHSWASIGKKNGVDIGVIGESLGHADTRTTQIYLTDFEEDVLDNANDRIVSERYIVFWNRKNTCLLGLTN
jgi:integrase/recombinase XerD